MGRHLIHVLANGAYEITNTVKSSFPYAVRLMCWTHVAKDVDQKLKRLPQTVKTQIRREIEVLQYATNDEQFRSGNNVFCQF